jgi:hypothetical protein
LMLVGCSTSPPADVAGLSRAIGTELPGAQGLTLADQERIDDTVARGCASGVYLRLACDRHTAASAERRAAERNLTKPARTE